MSLSTPSVLIGWNGRFFPNNWRPITQEISFAQSCGLGSIQFSDRSEGFKTALGLDWPAAADLIAQAAITAVLEIVVQVNEAGLTPFGASPLDILRANLGFITTLPCPYVHWHLVPINPMQSDTIRNLETSLIPQFHQALEIASKHNFKFGFEHNAPQLGLFGTPESCAAMLEAVPGLTFVWDFNHTIPEHVKGFQTLIPRMSHLHISDSPLPVVNHHLPLGEGSINYDNYCQALILGNFSGPAILEIGGNPQAGGFGGDTDKALIDSAEKLARAFSQAGRDASLYRPGKQTQNMRYT